MRAGSLEVCGLRVADGNITLPRRRIQRYRAMLHRASVSDPDQLTPAQKNQLRGHLAFLKMATDICPASLEPLLKIVINRHGDWLFKKSNPPAMLTYTSLQSS